MSMPDPIEFWFDFSSPYAYFASLRIGDLAKRHGRGVVWRPFLLGVAFAASGNAPLTEQPMKGVYSRRDWDRMARRNGIPLVIRDDFPLRTQAPARMVYAVEAASNAEAAANLASGLLRALFAEGRNIADATTAAGIAAEMGFDENSLASAAGDTRWKDELRQRTNEALRRGIFGSPFIFVDGEPFWGADRLPMIIDWLETGGW